MYHTQRDKHTNITTTPNLIEQITYVLNNNRDQMCSYVFNTINISIVDLHNVIQDRRKFCKDETENYTICTFKTFYDWPKYLDNYRQVPQESLIWIRIRNIYDHKILLFVGTRKNLISVRMKLTIAKYKKSNNIFEWMDRNEHKRGPIRLMKYASSNSRLWLLQCMFSTILQHY